MATPEVNTALENLQRELERLAPAIKHVELAQQVTKTLQTIPSQHITLLEAIKAENQHLVDNTLQIQEQVKIEQQYLVELKEKISNHYDILLHISFPDRLDKLDNNVSAVTLAVQSLQHRIENLERNIVDRMKEGADQQKQSQIALQQHFDQRLKKNAIGTYINWALIVGAVVAAILMLKR